MTASWQNAPMVTLNADVDCSSFKNMRESLRTLFKEKGLNLSYNYILMKMCALALKENPMLNSYLDGNEVVLLDEINIGLAVAIEGPNSPRHKRCWTKICQIAQKEMPW